MVDILSRARKIWEDARQSREASQVFWHVVSPVVEALLLRFGDDPELAEAILASDSIWMLFEWPGLYDQANEAAHTHCAEFVRRGKYTVAEEHYAQTGEAVMNRLPIWECGNSCCRIPGMVWT